MAAWPVCLTPTRCPSTSWRAALRVPHDRSRSARYRHASARAPWPTGACDAWRGGGCSARCSSRHGCASRPGRCRGCRARYSRRARAGALIHPRIQTCAGRDPGRGSGVAPRAHAWKPD
eukprot:3450478-Pleurochrysis_carterae.AAC.2